jgi:hypothetical protein
MKRFLAICCCMVIVLSACESNAEPTLSLDDQVGTAAAATREIAGNAATIAAQTVLAWEIEHFTPTPTVTSTPVPTIGGEAISNSNCRTGPASAFPPLLVINQGQNAQVTGQNTVATPWYQLLLETGDQCWVMSDNLTITGDVTTLEEIESPPTPQPPATLWAGQWTIWQYDICGPNGETCVQTAQATFVMTGPNSISSNYQAKAWCGIRSHPLSLTISEDGGLANGRITLASCDAYTLHLRLDPYHNQFRGYWVSDRAGSSAVAYCGAKNGAGQPSPCQ